MVANNVFFKLIILTCLFLSLGTSWSFFVFFARGVMLTLQEVPSITEPHPRSSSVQFVACCPIRPSVVVKLWRGCVRLREFLLATNVLKSKLPHMHWELFAYLLDARYDKYCDMLKRELLISFVCSTVAWVDCLMKLVGSIKMSLLHLKLNARSGPQLLMARRSS